MSRDLAYMHPKARVAFDKAQKDANMSVVVVQTQGAAAASAGTHASDGHYIENGTSHSYSAAVDFSVNQGARRLSDGAKITMDSVHIKWFLSCLARQGFVAWYRRPSQGFDAVHIHAVFAGVPVKPMLEAQIIDFLNDRTGLKGHAKESFWCANDDLDQHIATLFAIANPEAARRLPARLRGKAV